MGSATQLPMLAWQADRLQVWGLLVMEYSQDRLRAEIRQLRDQIEYLDQEYNRQRSATMIAEILLCIVAFVTGVFVGAFV